MQEDLISSAFDVVLNLLQLHFGKILDSFRSFYDAKTSEKSKIFSWVVWSHLKTALWYSYNAKWEIDKKW